MENKKGNFYGIGVGVGDEENITLKAVKKLADVDVIILPEAKTGEGSTAFSIVKNYVKDDVEQVFLEFPMVRDLEARKTFRKNNADIINGLLSEGKNVAFLTIGDPMTYSTYTYVLEHILPEIKVETIAGINSFNSMAARLDRWREAIVATGNTENIIIVSNCGKESEEIYTDIEKLESVHYFSTLILKKKGINQWKRFIL